MVFKNFDIAKRCESCINYIRYIDINYSLPLRYCSLLKSCCTQVIGSNSKSPLKYVGKIFGAMNLCKELKSFPWKCTFKKTFNVTPQKITMREKLTRHLNFSFKNGFMIEYTVYKYNGSLRKWKPWNLKGKLSLKYE